MTHAGYATQSLDTDERAERVQFAIWRRMSPAEKLRLLSELWAMLRQMALADLRRRYPRAADRELFLRLAARSLDRDTMRRAYGWDPELGARA